MNLASLITGQYDFQFIPISLPTAQVLALIPTSLYPNSTNPFLSKQELLNLNLPFTIPSAGEGNNWIVIECGQQINTGMKYIPGGKSTFYEAKLQIPFLRHPLSQSDSPITTSFTYKQTLLFSSLMMTISGSKITGLKTSKASFNSEGTEVEGWLEIDSSKSTGEGDSKVKNEWSEELVRNCIQGWWFGDRTGSTVTRFIMNSISTPIFQNSINVELNLQAFTDGKLGEEEAKFERFKTIGWKLNEETKMEARSVVGI